ncbi:MAG: hypothetical protein PVJ75_04760, partial [Chloroflexota bacterium]
MSNDEDPIAPGDSIVTSLFIVIGLILTLAVAILLGLSDGQQVRALSVSGATPVNQLAAATLELPTAELPRPAPTPTSTSTPEPTPTTTRGTAQTVTPTAVAVLAEVQCGNVPERWSLYTVQKGDNLLKLSA